MYPEGIVDCRVCGKPTRGLGGGCCEDCEAEASLPAGDGAGIAGKRMHSAVRPLAYRLAHANVRLSTITQDMHEDITVAEFLSVLRSLTPALPPSEAGDAGGEGGGGGMAPMVRFAAPAPSGSTNNRWQCGNCDAPPVTTEGHSPPMQCPACQWIDGAWKWLGNEQG